MSEEQPDIADIIAGELQTSRAHAYELMERALAARSTPKQGDAMPRLEFIGLPPGEIVPFGSFDADGETPATVVFKFCPSPSVEPAPPPQQVEPGWVRVPVEPTQEMLKAAERVWETCTDGQDFLHEWQAMVLAAPKEPKP